MIEGGATAYASLQRLGWDTFTITDEIAPGVIRMRAPNGTHVTMKPGSYPWGGLFPSK
nr:nucleotide-binding domain containing protein [Duncaniella freteri]